jgi:hypothetical protein
MGVEWLPFSMSKRKFRLTVSLYESGIRDRILFLGGGNPKLRSWLVLEVA